MVNNIFFFFSNFWLIKRCEFLGGNWKEDFNTTWHKNKQCIEFSIDRNIPSEERECYQVFSKKRRHQTVWERRWNFSRIFLPQNRLQFICGMHEIYVKLYFSFLCFYPLGDDGIVWFVLNFLVKLICVH